MTIPKNSYHDFSSWKKKVSAILEAIPPLQSNVFTVVLFLAYNRVCKFHL